MPTFFNVGKEPTSIEALKLAYLQNPDLLSTIEDIQAKEKEIKTNEARYLPRLDLQARKNLGTSSDGQNSNAAADVLELVMNFNLFNGFSDENLIRQTAEKLNSSRDMRDKACVDTRQVVSIAYNDINQLQTQRSYREKHTLSIENAREAYRKQFDIGQRTLLDLLDTENEYFQSRRALANTQYDMQIAYARLYAGQGELLRKIGVARGNLPEYSRAEYMDAENVCQAVAPVQITVDKAALVADAKPLSSIYASLAQPLGMDKLDKRLSTPAVVCNADEVTARVKDWAASWRTKNADAHFKFYADKFMPQAPMDKALWTKQRKQNLLANSKIAPDLNTLQVTCDGNTASAKFKQDSNSADAARADKELRFERINQQWQIVRELTLQ